MKIGTEVRLRRDQRIRGRVDDPRIAKPQGKNLIWVQWRDGVRGWIERDEIIARRSAT